MFDIKLSDNYEKQSNGVFIHDCLTHCSSFFGADFNTIQIDGRSMREALGDWWNEAPVFSFIHSFFCST